MPDQTDPFEAEDALLEKAIHLLSEHFDTVQIFVTRFDGADDGKTFHMAKGTGNFWARFGSVQGWIKRQEAEDCRPPEIS